jgi:hypothetical protein
MPTRGVRRAPLAVSCSFSRLRLDAVSAELRHARVAPHALATAVSREARALGTAARRRRKG